VIIKLQGRPIRQMVNADLNDISRVSFVHGFNLRLDSFIVKKGATIGACRIAPSIPDGMHCDRVNIYAKAGQHKADR
jgi:hypothetical protein